MTLKISEQISQRRDLGNDISAGIDAAIEDVSSGFGEYLSPVVAEGEEQIDTRHQLVLIRRRVDGHVNDLDALDAGVVEKVHDTDKARLDVDGLSDFVVSTMRSVRHTVRGAFGPDGVARTGLRGRFPSRPLRVYERGRLVQTSLRNPDLGLKPALKVVAKGEGQVEEEGPGLKPSDLAAEFEPALTQLGDTLKARYADKREDIDARYLRQNGIKTFDRHIRGIVRILQGIFVLAGRDDLARRFTTRLPRFIRRLNEAEDEPPSADPPPPAGSEPITDSDSTP